MQTGSAGPPVRLHLGQGHGTAWTGIKITMQVRQTARAKVDPAEFLPPAENTGGWKSTVNDLIAQHLKPGQVHWRGKSLRALPIGMSAELSLRGAGLIRALISTVVAVVEG
jgi:hypothetical protein